MTRCTASDDAANAAARQGWMRLFALSDAAALEAALPGGLADEVRVLRAPEVGLVMVRGRTGGGGAPFNLGEMPVARCSVALADGTVGHAYVAGRDRAKARAAAILDALMQRPEARAELERTLIAPLSAALAARRQAAAEKTAATRVDFFTMVRGD
ncbi:phosphonate C-P lyase system protein PhnG [Oleispirillum naphthae]|uniref:phosphonate C-P lyase system protein PhnG n=1 Tax=Oleispirillum naphthae TaxID=2838853 RepID=UPI0030825D4A